MPVKSMILPIDGNDTSGAIRVAFASMPAADQALLIEALQPKAPRLRWLEPPAAARVVAILDDLDPASRDLVETRLLPLWIRRARRQTARDDAIRAAARFYAEHLTCRGIAQAIAAHCRRLPPPGDPRREAIERILTTNRGKPLGVTTIRNALAGLTRDPGQK